MGLNTNIVLEEIKTIAMMIPKCATNSLRKALCDEMGYLVPKQFNGGDPFHYVAKWIVNEERYSDWRKFTFVRNPFDRLISCWCEHVSPEAISAEDPMLIVPLLHVRVGELKTFHEFIAFLAEIPEEDYERVDQHVRPQYLHVKMEKKTPLMPHFIGRVENLQADWECFGFKSKIEHRHKGLFKREHYSEFYNAKTRQLAEKFIGYDLELFGYKFEMRR